MKLLLRWGRECWAIGHALWHSCLHDAELFLPTSVIFCTRCGRDLPRLSSYGYVSVPENEEAGD